MGLSSAQARKHLAPNFEATTNCPIGIHDHHSRIIPAAIPPQVALALGRASSTPRTMARISQRPSLDDTQRPRGIFRRHGFGSRNWIRNNQL